MKYRNKNRRESYRRQANWYRRGELEKKYEVFRRYGYLRTETAWRETQCSTAFCKCYSEIYVLG
jgi:hypothetical protein